MKQPLKVLKNKIFLLVVLALVLVVAAMSYKKVFVNDKELLSKTVNSFESLKYVKADMDIEMIVKQDGKDDITTAVTGLASVDMVKNSQKTNMNVDISGVSLSIEMIILENKSLYLKMPFLNPNWILFDMEKLAETEDLPVNLRTNDYAAQAKAFLSALKLDTANRVGTEKVMDQNTVMYEVEIDKDKFIKNMEGSVRDDSLKKAFEGTEISSTIWVNPTTFKVVKMATRVKGMAIGQGILGSADMTITATYSDFDKEVVIQAPTETIVTYEELAKTNPTLIPSGN